MLMLGAPDRKPLALNILRFENALYAFVEGCFGHVSDAVRQGYGVVSVLFINAPQNFQHVDHRVVVVGDVVGITSPIRVELGPTTIGVLCLLQVEDGFGEGVLDARLERVVAHGFVHFGQIEDFVRQRAVVDAAIGVLGLVGQ